MFLSIINNPSAVVQTINNYSEHDWAPFNWVRHFSDKPYPNTINPDLFRNIEDLKGYFQPLFNSAPEPWQLRLPWAPYTATEGQRFRTNIKVIYDMNAFFDEDQGAFSGNPKAITSEMVYNNFISDDQLDKKELINDLKYGRKIIVENDEHILHVYNVSPNIGDPDKFVSSTITPR